MTDFDRVIDRRLTGSVKWNRYPEDVLPMWVADMDFLSPPSVTSALKKRVEQGVFGYSAPNPSLQASVCSWLKKRHNWEVSPESVVIIPNVVCGFYIAARASASPGDFVLLQTPAYRPFFNVAPTLGLNQQVSPLVPDSRGCFSFSSSDLTQTINPNTRVFMFCNPHNPTGRVFLTSELERIAELCLDNDIIICSDEIHSDLIYSGFHHVPMATLSPQVAESTITLISPSKTFNLAGLKTAAAIITNPELRSRFLKASQGLIGKTNSLGNLAMETAYTKSEAWLEELLAYLGRNRTFLSEFIEQELPQISLHPPQGTFLAWLDCRRAGLDSPGEYFLKHARVAVNPGTWFGENGKGYARLNFACPSSILEQGLLRIKSSLE